MAGLTTSRAKVPLVVTFAGAAPFVLPVGADGLVVFAKKEFSPELICNGLVKVIPGGRGLAVYDSVGSTCLKT